MLSHFCFPKKNKNKKKFRNIFFNVAKERLAFLYIIKCKLQVQKEALYRLDYITLGKYKL